MATTAQTPSDFNIKTCDEPTMGEAMKASLEERRIWTKAIEDELNALDDMETWVIDENPKCPPLPTHIVLKIKTESDDRIERFKAESKDSRHTLLPVETSKYSLKTILKHMHHWSLSQLFAFF